VQVLVASIGAEMLVHRMRLARDLWQAGISCMYLPQVSTHGLTMSHAAILYTYDGCSGWKTTHFSLRGMDAV
jgi:hypothetical protein